MEKSNNRIFGGDLVILGDVIKHYLHVAKVTETQPSSGNVFSGGQAKLVNDEIVKNHMNKATSLQKLYDTYVDEEIAKANGILVAATKAETDIIRQSVVKETPKVTKSDNSDNVVMEIVHNVKKVLDSTEPEAEKDIDETILGEYIRGEKLIPNITLANISKHYALKGVGTIIESEITEADRKDAASLHGSIVIEKRGHEEKSHEIKRNKSGKELAASILANYITSMGDDISGCSNQGLRKAASRLTANYSYIERKNENEKAISAYKKADLPISLNVFELKSAKEIVKMRKKFLTNGSFNMEVLVNRAVNKEMSSQDMLITQVVQLVASKQFDKACNVIIKYYKEAGHKEMNIDMAYLYINDLMKQREELNEDENKEIVVYSPYDSLRGLIDNLLLADPKDHLKYHGTLIDLIKAYSTRTFTVKEDGKDVLKSNCWNDHRIVKMINKRINQLSSENKLVPEKEDTVIAILTSNNAGIVPVSKLIEKPLLPLKADKVANSEETEKSEETPATTEETKETTTEKEVVEAPTKTETKETSEEKVEEEVTKEVTKEVEVKPEEKSEEKSETTPPSKTEIKGKRAPNVVKVEKVVNKKKETKTVDNTVSDKNSNVETRNIKVNIEHSADKKTINFELDGHDFTINNKKKFNDDGIKKAIKGKLLGYISQVKRNNEKAATNDSIKEKTLPESLKDFQESEKLKIELVSKAS